jgi:hypothetical protein
MSWRHAARGDKTGIKRLNDKLSGNSGGRARPLASPPFLDADDRGDHGTGGRGHCSLGECEVLGVEQGLHERQVDEAGE